VSVNVEVDEVNDSRARGPPLRAWRRSTGHSPRPSGLGRTPEIGRRTRYAPEARASPPVDHRRVPGPIEGPGLRPRFASAWTCRNPVVRAVPPTPRGDAQTDAVKDRVGPSGHDEMVDDNTGAHGPRLRSVLRTPSDLWSLRWRHRRSIGRRRDTSSAGS
jgi:hypothetical protein